MRIFLFFFLIINALNLKAQDKISVPDSLDRDSISYAGFPVTVYDKNLFYIKNSIGPLSAKERARLATEKIVELEKDLATKTDSIILDTTGGNANIIYKNIILVAITQADAKANQSTVNQLATNYQKAIVDIINKYRNENNIVEIAKRVGFGLLIILLLVLIIFYLNRYINRFKEWLSYKLNNKIDGIKIRNYELLSQDSQMIFIRRAINVGKYFIIILTIYLTLPIIFQLFPWTKTWSDALINFILIPLKSIVSSIIDFIPNLISIIIIVMFFRYIVKGLGYLAGEVAAGKLKLNGFYPDWAQPTFKIIKFVLYAFMVVVIWPKIPGSDSDIFKGVSVFLGLLVSFGSSSAIGNMVAGLVITYMRPFVLKDRVKIGDVTGDVVEKSLLVTRLRTIKNEIVTIPNSAILSGNTINYTVMAKKEGSILHTTITIGYDEPWRKIHDLLISAALASEGIDTKRKPFVLQTSLEDWYVAYQINAYTKQPERSALIYSNLHANIQDKFNEAGVEIMSSHYQTLRDGNKTTIPSDYLPDDYEVPSFVIEKDDKKEDKI
ncbi:mechanosensitive ion channel [Pedobacter sp. SD-b]|uniref:Mechanosensitive ion channel n=1 Tax=Pedobacter segetis TaxID=2793069 RepID=A0ABS1BHP2_9SPHI|nr:mechanosensitive ion channel domain-containing protein [Pedobacter segetis]MBK0382332.1 mechanosensitive ion channel [Pedobacter segetis]